MNGKNAEAFKVGFLLIDGFALMSYAAGSEPLRAANLIANRELYEIRNFPEIGLDARSSSGAIIESDIEVAELQKLDLLLVAAGGEPSTYDNAETFRLLRRLSKQGVTLGGLSGGPVILAAAGVMQGRRMTVHWEHRPVFEEKYPDLLVEKQLYLIDRNRMTCAGGTAALDMMHALLTEHHGAGFARKVSDWFMHTEFRPPERPQRAGLVERYGTNSQPVIAAIKAMENHIADVLDLQRLAQITEISERQLNRLFNEKLGSTTMGFYRVMRLQKAKSLLQYTSLSITDIALTTGFNSSSHFSSSFRSCFDCTPKSQRLKKAP